MNAKTIKINQDIYKNLTFDEILEMYQGLIYSFITKFQEIYPQFLLENDDLYQIFSMSLYKAYKNYDISKDVGFGLVAQKYLTQKNMNIYSKNTAKKRNNKRYHELSMDNCNNIIDIETMESRFNVIIIIDYINKLNPKDKKIIYEMYVNGCKLKLKNKIGVSRTTINKKLKKHKEMLKEILLEGGVNI